jgi:parallel beta-helix repeat protein
MNKKESMKSELLICVLLLTTHVAKGQGPLYPSAPPAPTMKSLEELDAAITGTSNAVEAVQTAVEQVNSTMVGVSHRVESVQTAIEQVEARIDLATVAGDANYHHVIRQPGSYYLSGNLGVTKTSGILILASNVTLDLNGFCVSRGSGTGGNGIVIADAGDQATVRNGSISGFSRGVFASSEAEGLRLHQLTASQCSEYGIWVFGNAARLIDCIATRNTGSGISVGYGASLSGCVASYNQGSYGILAQASILSGCTAYRNEGTGSSSYGIYASGSSVIGCMAYGNRNTNASSTSIQGVGIFVNGGVVKDCRVAWNQGDGILVGNNSLVSGNVCYGIGNGGDGAGIHVLWSDNRIENNTVNGNDRGIDVDSSGNLIVRNSASDNTTNYDISAGNKVGTIQTTPVGAGAWDNFEF